MVPLELFFFKTMKQKRCSKKYLVVFLIWQNSTQFSNCASSFIVNTLWSQVIEMNTKLKWESIHMWAGRHLLQPHCNFCDVCLQYILVTIQFSVWTHRTLKCHFLHVLLSDPVLIWWTCFLSKKEMWLTVTGYSRILPVTAALKIPLGWKSHFGFC